MRLLIQALLFATATSYVAALPIQNPAADQACYYKRSLNTYVRRAPGGAEIACAAPTLTSIERAVDLGILPQANNACYYKRDINRYVRRTAGGAEVACKIERSVDLGILPEANNACYYKRDSGGKTVGYKRNAHGAEILCK